MNMPAVSDPTRHVSPLIVTPPVDRRESAIGYVLRLCEANGYPSTSTFLRGTNLLSGTEQILGGSAAFLSEICLMDIATAEHLAIRKADGFSYYLLSQRLPTRELILYHHRICPACIHADRIHDASWHLSLVTHCPIHKIRLLESCSRCSYSYRIQRPSTTHCRCKASITPNGDPSLCSQPAASLFATVRAKLFNDVAIAATPKEFSSYDNVSLPTFVALVNALRKVVSIENSTLLKGQNRAARDAVIEVVALALTQLPQGIDVLYGTLRGSPIAADEHLPDAFTWFKNPCLGFSKSKELAFMNHLIDAFAAQRRGLPVKPRRATVMHRSSQFLETWVLAEDAGASTECNGDNVRKAAHLRLLTSTRSARNRLMVSRAEVSRLQRSAWPGLEADQAAEVAGISVDLFKRLSRSRIYIALFIPDGAGPYSREDAQQLRVLIKRASPLVIKGVGQTVKAFLRRTPKSMLNFTRALVDTLEGVC